MKTHRRLASLAIVGAVLLLPLLAVAQRPIWEGAVSAGSGLSFGSGNGRAVVLPSPFYIDADIIYSNDESPTIEYVVGLQAELQGRVSAGVVPQIRLTSPPRKLLVYGLLGAPIIIAPFTLFGVEGGVGVLWRVVGRIGVFAEVVLDLFPWGSDLPQHGILTQLDANVGVRVKFK
ncbi:MAG: hypothetical protein MUC50_06375 [Myxococcota bacterium]|nr:hypothetical protein [Myxococcota bacterium]